MNFFHSLFKSKLDAMRAAAPRATLHLLHESNGFSVYLGEAAAAHKVTQLGTLTDHAEDVLMDDPVLHLFVPLEHAVKFVDEVTGTHSVALVDVILADKVHAARYVMYAYFPRKAKGDIATLQNRLAQHDGCTRWGVEDMGLLSGMYDKPAKYDQFLITSADHDAIKMEPGARRFFKLKEAVVPEFLAPAAAVPALLAEKDEDADFWG